MQFPTTFVSGDQDQQGGSLAHKIWSITHIQIAQGQQMHMHPLKGPSFIRSVFGNIISVRV